MGTMALGVLAALTTAGAVTLGGGLAEHENAGILNSPDSIFVSTAGTVEAKAGVTEWSQMPVRFVTDSGQAVETMVWTRVGNRDFNAGEAVALEYVSQHPAAARLADGRGGPAKSMGTIVTGLGILAGAFLLAGAWVWELFAGVRRRAMKRAEGLQRR